MSCKIILITTIFGQKLMSTRNVGQKILIDNKQRLDFNPEIYSENKYGIQNIVACFESFIDSQFENDDFIFEFQEVLTK